MDKEHRFLHVAKMLLHPAFMFLPFEFFSEEKNQTAETIDFTGISGVALK